MPGPERHTAPVELYVGFPAITNNLPLKQKAIICQPNFERMRKKVLKIIHKRKFTLTMYNTNSFFQLEEIIRRLKGAWCIDLHGIGTQRED